MKDLRYLLGADNSLYPNTPRPECKKSTVFTNYCNQQSGPVTFLKRSRFLQCFESIGIIPHKMILKWYCTTLDSFAIPNILGKWTQLFDTNYLAKPSSRVKYKYTKYTKLYILYSIFPGLLWHQRSAQLLQVQQQLFQAQNQLFHLQL